jgi:hypothetical protein
VAKDVEGFLSSSAEAGPYLPARQTIWPRPKQFRLRVQEVTLKRLAELAARHAEPEVLDHFFVYAGAEPLMEYPDAFDWHCPILVAHDAGEPQIRSFANELQLEVVEVGSA